MINDSKPLNVEIVLLLQPSHDGLRGLCTTNDTGLVPINTVVPHHANSSYRTRRNSATVQCFKPHTK